MYKRIKRLYTCNFFIINFNKNRLIYMKLEILWVGNTQSTYIAVHQSKLTKKKYKNKKHHSLGFFPGRTLIFNPPMEQAKCFSFWRYENYDNFMKQMHPHMTFSQTWATCVISINMMMRLQLHWSKEITTKQYPLFLFILKKIALLWSFTMLIQIQMGKMNDPKNHL